MGCGCRECSRTVTPQGATGAIGYYSGTKGIIALAAANSYDLSSADTGKSVFLDKADGSNISLPPATIGLNYDFEISKPLSSGSYTITTATPTDVYKGYLYLNKEAGYWSIFYPNGDSNDTLTLNGTTKGGLVGTSFNITCYETGKWYVQGYTYGSGTLETPFSD